MTSFLDLAKARFSVRDFKPERITREELLTVLEAARVAPSAKNTRPHRIYVLESEEVLERVRALTPCAFNAPTVLAIGYDLDRECRTTRLDRRYGEADAAIAVTHMMLCAHDLGLGSCYVGWFRVDEMSEALGLPDNVVLTALLPIGYPAEGVVPNERHTVLRPFEETVEFL